MTICSCSLRFQTHLCLCRNCEFAQVKRVHGSQTGSESCMVFVLKTHSRAALPAPPCAGNDSERWAERRHCYSGIEAHETENQCKSLYSCSHKGREQAAFHWIRKELVVLRLESC